MLCRTRPKHGTPPVRSPACPCLHVRSGLLHPQSSRQCMSPLKRRRVGCGKLASCVTPQTSEFSLFCLLTWPRPTLPPCHMHTQSSWSYATRAFGDRVMPDVCRRRSLLHFLTSLRFTPHLRLCAQSTANLFWGRAGGAKKHHWHAPQSPQSTEYTKVGVSINGAQDRQSSWPNMLWPSNVSTSFGGWTAVVGRSSCRRQSSLPFSERPTCTRTVPKFRDCVLVRNACMRA